jgi:hypothetical protein
LDNLSTPKLIFGRESPKEGDHLEDQSIYGRLGLEWLLKRLAGGGVEWIHLAQDRDQWQAVVNLQVLVPQS